MKTIGFIGTGYMGGALATAACKSGLDTRILLANRSKEKAEKLAKEIGGEVVDNAAVAKEADYIFLGVKPQILQGMFEKIEDILKERKDDYVIVSMVAGKDIAFLKKMFFNHPIIRISPNMPVLVGSGLSQYVFSDDVSTKDREFFLKLMEPTGVLIQNDEHYMSGVSGVTGCGPAFAAMFIEALADGAVACGVGRKDAYIYAAEMLKGTADLYLKSGQHPGAIKDSVCSPAGLTIEGVRVLERLGFRSAVIEALIATFEKRV
ncbi:MAG: pyrroline-5-carboxylate reductase [Erysipelotrichaceae bacterium]|nr:pyrroline-5-carboxylate reductase [Erysipelotrichaceae bacterium]